VCIAIWNPIIAILMLILVDFLMMAMKLYYFNITTFIVYLAMAMVTMFRISRTK